MDSNLLFALLVGFSGVALLLSILGNIAGSVPMHAFLYSAIWAVCIGASEVALGGTIRPDVATTLVLFGAWWAFLVGSILPLIAGRFRGPGAPARIRRFPAVAAIWVLMALQWCGVLYEVLHVDKSGRSLSPSTLLSDLMALRVSGASVDNPLPPFLGSFRWSHVIYIPLALLLRSNRSISRRQLFAILVLATVSAAVHFTRAPIVQLFLVTFVSWVAIYRPTRRTIWTASACIGVALLLIFVSAQVAINEQNAAKTSLEQSLSAYFGMSPLAYQDILQGQFPREPGFYTLDAAYFVLTKAGAHVTYPGLARPQIWFPFVTNVYTYLDVFTLDGGIPGALLGACLVGVLCSSAYRLNRRRSSLLTLSMYAYFCYCCLMTPINNEFIRANTLITLMIAWALTWLIRARPARLMARSPQGGGLGALQNS